MEQGMNEQHNPDVYVGNKRFIAVRGLIPGHEGSEVYLPNPKAIENTTEPQPGGAQGILKRFYHRSDGYTEVTLEDGYSVAFPHLTEIGIRA